MRLAQRAKADTTLVTSRTIQQNPTRFPNPSEFDPNRFINDTQTAAEAANNPDVSMRDHFVFGTGRRLCPGIHIADRSMFLAVSRLLWAFRIEAEIDELGNRILPDRLNVTQGSLAQPMPFPVRIVPRSEMHARVVRKEWAMCQTLLDNEGQWLDVPKELNPQSTPV